MPTITIQMLNEMSSGARACKPAREWFQEKFPDGGELFEVWNACRAWRWKVWFAAHSATADVVIEFARECAERAAAYAADATAANAAEATATDYAAAAADYARDAAADYAVAPAPTAYYDAEIQAQLAWARGILF